MTSAATLERRRRYRRGLRGEVAAMLALMLKGYLPVAWRYKTPLGEIDLILRRGRRLAFVEVKARRTHDAAAVAVHVRNQYRVVRAAQYYLASHPQPATCEIRFDVCLVAWYRWPKHIPHAFM